MKWKAPPQTDTAEAAFAMLISLLCEMVATEGFRLRIGQGLTILIWQRICRIAARFTWLVAHGPASLRVRRRSPRKPKAKPPIPDPAPTSDSPYPEPAKPKPLKLPAGFNWLHRILPSEQVAAARGQLEYLLAQPYFVDQVEANATLCRLLRPLCHMLGAKLPTILQINPPAPLFADPTPPRVPYPRQTLARDSDFESVTEIPEPRFYENFAV